MRLVVFVLAVAPCLEMFAGDGYEVVNPHGDPTRCQVCHRAADRGALRTRSTGNSVALCDDCHDGHHAVREAHPVSIIPSMEVLQNMPDDFPLTRGKLTCLTCHDVTVQCLSSPAAEGITGHLLRGGNSWRRGGVLPQLSRTSPAAF